MVALEVDCGKAQVREFTRFLRSNYRFYTALASRYTLEVDWQRRLLRQCAVENVSHEFPASLKDP